MSASPRPDDDGTDTVTRDELEAGEVNIWDSVEGRPVDVRGHPYDVPDERLPLRIEEPNGEVTILVSSDMRADPVEGVQGSYTVVVDEDEPCGECGETRTRISRQTLAGVACASCAVCDSLKRPM